MISWIKCIDERFLFSELTLNPPEGIIAGPVNEENFFEWEALIMYVFTCSLYKCSRRSKVYNNETATQQQTFKPHKEFICWKQNKKLLQKVGFDWLSVSRVSWSSCKPCFNDYSVFQNLNFNKWCFIVWEIKLLNNPWMISHLTAS